MPILDIIFGTGPQKTEVGAITIDATITENHRRASQITDHPIETGSNIQDHIFREPRRLDLVGEVTDSPVHSFGLLDGSAFQLGGVLGDLIGLTERRLEAFEQFEAMHESRELVKIVTGLTVYEDMALIAANFPKNNQTGKRLLFRLSFQEIVKVTTRTADLPAEQVKPANRDAAASGTSRGKQTPGTVDQATEETATTQAKNGSVLHDILIGG